MSALPDELWLMSLETGVATARLNHRDLCCVSIVCPRLRRLSDDPSLWSALLAHDFPLKRDPSSSDPPSFKSLYAEKLKEDRERRKAAWRRRVMSAKRQAAAWSKGLGDLEEELIKVRERMKAAEAERANREMVRFERDSERRDAACSRRFAEVKVAKYGKRLQDLEEKLIKVWNRMKEVEAELANLKRVRISGNRRGEQQ